MPIGEVFLGAFLQVVFDRIAPREIKEFIRRLELNLDDDLETLEQTMLMIQAVLHDAEHKQITNKAVRDWLEKLTHLAYDIDDLFDEIQTDAARLKLKEECSRSDTTNQVRDFFSPILNYWSDSKKSGKIKKLIERFDKVEKRSHVLGLLVGEQSSNMIPASLQRPPTSSLPLDSRVYGREQDVQKLLKLLLSDDETGEQGSKVSVIPIVGMGGVGKTTLAQHLYNHEEVSKRFNLKVWVCVSDAKFDLIRVTKEILESATKESSTLQGLQVLQEKLKEILSQKKFLLVLDDVWSDVYGDWDHLRAPFKDGPRGSKIIVTTRSEKVSSMMRTVPTYPLRVLSEEDCQSLFNQHAYENGSADAHPELKPIGEKIVKQCKGLPLAAKTLGGLLRCKLRTAEWEGILNSKIWEDETGILPSLRLSYHYLPAHLKQCFSYCAIFRQDHEFDEKELVLLWMAEGFLQPQPQQRNMSMEDIGDEYFHDLLSRSFFQRSTSNESRYVMHDLIHDLAQYVSRGICFCFKDGLQGEKLSEVDKSLVRYTLVPLDLYNAMVRFEAFHESKSLRTLLLISSTFVECYTPKKIPQYLISKLPCLRVLCFGNCINLYELPESIGDLKHLRYIDLSRTNIERLPESMSTLLNLQTLVLSNCKRLVELLNGMDSLTNLRHLYIDGCHSLREMPLGIDKLKNLQTLPMFVVGENSGSRIEVLRDIKQLRDKLSITRLKNVVNICGAILGNKLHIYELDLNWSFPCGTNSEREDVDSGDGSREVAIINELQPHTSLKRLTISWYYDTKFPDWLGYTSYSNLVNLELIDCRRCQFLPPLGCLPSLKNLQIKGLWRVKTMGSEFYGGGVLHTSPFQSLEQLVFEDMRDWDEWSGIVEEREEEFPSLCQLKIMNCPKLRKFSHRFVKLEELRIEQCGELTALPMCLPVLSKLHIVECNEMVLRSMVDSPPPSLASLNISKFSNLENLMLPLEGGGRPLLDPLTVVKQLKSYESVESVRRSLPFEIACFRSLDISECPQLVSLSDDEDVLSLRFSMSSCQNLNFFKFPSGIERLSIHNCPGFVSFPAKMELPTTLKSLEILQCDNLKLFPELVMCNGNNRDSIVLDILLISNCDSLTSFTRNGSSFGGLPLLPKHLIIRNCPNLISPPEVMMYNNRFLESLIIEICEKLTSFSSNGRCLGWFDPVIVVADNMNDDLPSSSQAKSGMMTSVLSTTITNVKVIKIERCKDLNSLPDSLYKLTSLRILNIQRCPSLVSFPDGGLPTTTLTEFTISECKNLEFLPDGLQKVTSLINLQLQYCPKLDPFPEGGFPGNLEKLEVEDCRGQKPMAEWGFRNLTSLHMLRIGGFPGVVAFPELLLPPNLTYLVISNLPDLQFLPEGLCNLAGLQIWNCDKIASLLEKELPSSLRLLDISYCYKLESFPEKCLPSSLQQLVIWDCDKLESFPEKCLPSSLQQLVIWDCDKLASFPEKWLPSSLCYLAIYKCPLLKEWFDTEKGKDCISDIPYFKITDCHVDTVGVLPLGDADTCLTMTPEGNSRIRCDI